MEYKRQIQDLGDVRELFVACEFKPYAPYWDAIEKHMSNVVPAFTHGRLGVLATDPVSYSIVNVTADEEPLTGYLMTSEVAGFCLADKFKGFNGLGAFNCHYRTLCHVFTEINKVVTAWCYVTSPSVLNAYKQIQQIPFGWWDKEDLRQKELLDTLV